MVLLSILFSANLIHGYVPTLMLKSVMVPIIKNKNKRITDRENCRPICISSVFSKLLENVLYSRLSKYLVTACNQFGFKAKHGTDAFVY